MAWETILAGVEKLLHWFSPRFMVFIFLLSAGLFFMPPAWASFLALDSSIHRYKPWLGGGMVLSAAYLIPFGVSPFVERRVALWRRARAIGHVMSNLAPDEKRLLRRFFFPSRNGRIIVWRHEIGRLESDGVLFCPGDAGLQNRQEVFCLTDEASRYIEKHRGFLAELEGINPNILA
jgi:hypothetical protein